MERFPTAGVGPVPREYDQTYQLSMRQAGSALQVTNVDKQEN